MRKLTLRFYNPGIYFPSPKIYITPHIPLFLSIILEFLINLQFIIIKLPNILIKISGILIKLRPFLIKTPNILIKLPKILIKIQLIYTMVSPLYNTHLHHLHTKKMRMKHFTLILFCIDFCFTLLYLSVTQRLVFIFCIHFLLFIFYFLL